MNEGKRLNNRQLGSLVHAGASGIHGSGRNLLRYQNHASPCNAEFDGFDPYARTEISRDDEITIDYGDHT